MRKIVLLTISNVFMTFAWYWHIKSDHLRHAPIWIAIIASWGIAFFEYCFQVPANRIGADSGLQTAQLKIMQEVITLSVFVLFNLAFFPDQKMTWNYWVSFGLVFAAVFFAFHK